MMIRRWTGGIQRRRFDMIALDCSVAVEILVAVGSGDDPIFHHGVETTAGNLEDAIWPLYQERGRSEPKAHRVNIEFYGQSGSGLRKTKGTLADMVRERLAIA